jgi:hypothetical protein
MESSLALFVSVKFRESDSSELFPAPFLESPFRSYLPGPQFPVAGPLSLAAELRFPV